jgi:hypothetical protein
MKDKPAKKVTGTKKKKAPVVKETLLTEVPPVEAAVEETLLTEVPPVEAAVEETFLTETPPVEETPYPEDTPLPAQKVVTSAVQYTSAQIKMLRAQFSRKTLASRFGITW